MGCGFAQLKGHAGPYPGAGLLPSFQWHLPSPHSRQGPAGCDSERAEEGGRPGKGCCRETADFRGQDAGPHGASWGPGSCPVPLSSGCSRHPTPPVTGLGVRARLPAGPSGSRCPFSVLFPRGLSGPHTQVPADTAQPPALQTEPDTCPGSARAEARQTRRVGAGRPEPARASPLSASRRGCRLPLRLASPGH